MAELSATTMRMVIRTSVAQSGISHHFFSCFRNANSSRSNVMNPDMALEIIPEKPVKSLARWRALHLADFLCHQHCGLSVACAVPVAVAYVFAEAVQKDVV